MSQIWLEMGKRSLVSAKELYDSRDYRGSVNRAYYALYQAATGICIQHGDDAHFPGGWNNPTHEQLPGLIRNNGDLSRSTREQIVRNLRFLRNARESADYRPGQTVDEELARDCLRHSSTVLKYFGVDDAGD